MKTEHINRIKGYDFIPFHVMDRFMLFSSSRIDRDDIPKGLYVYELRHNSEDDMELCQIKEHILVNFYGTVITDKPMDLEVYSKALENGDWGYLSNDYLSDELVEIKSKIATNASFFDKMSKCQSFFDSLADILSPEYEIVASCNADESRYLVPKGTADQITYHSKPDKSFRVSGHWNWYSNLKKNPDPNYVQCFSVDAPAARRRESRYATKPRKAVQVCVLGDDGKYHCIFGEVFNRRTQEWSFIAPEPMDIARRYMHD